MFACRPLLRSGIPFLSSKAESAGAAGMKSWHAAGDFDLRTQKKTRVILDLVHAREEFRLNSDDTSVDEAAREVQMRKPEACPMFNTTGSNLQHDELEAAVELLISTHREVYRQRLKELVPVVRAKFAFLGSTASRAIPLMDDQFRKDIAEALAVYKPKLGHMLAENPYAVPMSTGAWGGAGAVTQFATMCISSTARFLNWLVRSIRCLLSTTFLVAIQFRTCRMSLEWARSPS